MNFKKQLALLLALSFPLQSLALPINTVWAKNDDVEKVSKIEIKKDIPQYAQLMREFNAVKEEEVESVRPLSRAVSSKLDKNVKEEKKTKYTKEELDGVFEDFIDAEEEKLKDLGVDSKKQKQYLNRLKKQKEKIQKPEFLLSESKKTEQELKEVKIPDQPSGFNFQNDQIEVKSFGTKKKETSLLKNIYQTIAFWAVPETKADYALTALPELADLESDDQEITLTSEIYSLVDELENNPVKIFNFVRNNIDYEPYYGAKKGALGCLKEGVCNDTDATSLTIALMRAAGIPARYKKDLIQVPVEQLQTLLGVETTKAVYAGLGKNKVPVYVDANSNLDLSNGFENLDFSQETNLILEWTYPEIFYELDERGGNFMNETVLTGSEIETTSDLRNELITYPKKQWIGIDPIMKGYSNTHNEIVADTANFDTETFWKNFLQYQGTLSPIDKYANDLLTQTSKDINDVQYQSIKTLIQKEFQILAPSLPYEIVSNTQYPTEKWSVLPEARKHKVAISLINGSGTTVLSHELSASEVNNAPIDLFYEGATATDIATIESYGGIHATPAELVEIQPYLNFNYAKYTATENVEIGETLILRFEYSLNGVDLETSETFSVAGNNEGIYMTFSKIPENVFLDDATNEDQNSKILLEGNAEIARQYLLKMQKKGEALEKALDVNYNLYFGRAVVTQNRVLTKVDGVPTTFDFKGLTIDANLQVVDYSRQGDYANHTDDFHLLLGLEASYNEAQIFEDIAGLESISTVQGLQHAYANPNDYTIYEIESSNETVIDTLTNLSANTRADMHNEVQAGATVITPDDFVSSGNWYGIFYIVLNPDGTARYAIGEQVLGNGGWMTVSFDNDEVGRFINEGTADNFIFKDKILGEDRKCKIARTEQEEIMLDAGYSPEYGLPCLRKTKTFGTVEHTYIVATDGAKFYSPNKYDYWRTDDFVRGVLEADRNNDNLENLSNINLDSTFKFNTIAGTYSWYGRSGNWDKEFLTAYYEPNAGNVNRGYGRIVYGDILDKLVENSYDLHYEPCPVDFPACKKQNYILNILGYPVENKVQTDAYTIDWGRDTNGYKQDFIGGMVVQETNYFDETFYVPGKINETYKQNGGTGGEFGFPLEDPVYDSVNNTTSQLFSNGKEVTLLGSVNDKSLTIQINKGEELVNDEFIETFSLLQTPNPCVTCNRQIKFGALKRKMKELGSEYIATGHYAQIIKNQDNFELYEGIDKMKDQSYFLHQLNQETLSHIILPLGEFRKEEVKEFAKEIGLKKLSSKKESQGVCFYPDKNYVDFLRRYLAKKYFTPGEIMNLEGNVLGKHNGLINYTIGQRKGVLVGGQEEPIYVIGFNLENNQLILGSDEELWKDEIKTKDNYWITEDLPEEDVEIDIRIRHLAKKEKAILRKLEDKNYVIKLKSPLRAITPGQSAVYYDGEKVLGGGIII